MCVYIRNMEVCFLGQQQRSDLYPVNPVATAVGTLPSATMAIILALALGGGALRHSTGRKFLNSHL